MYGIDAAAAGAGSRSGQGARAKRAGEATAKSGRQHQYFESNTTHN